MKIISKYNKLPKIIKASIWFFICTFIQRAISIITTPIFTRLMSSEEYGKYSVFNSWESLLTIFITLNISYGVYNQGIVKFDNDRKVFSSSMQGLTISMISICFLIYYVFRDYFNNLMSLNTTYVIIMFLIIWVSTIYNFWSSEQRVNYNYKHLIIITLFASFFAPTLGIIFIFYFKDKVLARLLGILISYFIFYFWMFFSQISNGKVFFSKKYWLYALKFNIPLLPHYLSQVVLNDSDRIMIAKIENESTAGIYSLAYSISFVMLLFNSALNLTITPWIYKKIKKKEISSISNIGYICLIIIASVNILLIAFAPEIVKIFAPFEYYSAIYVIPPVAMSVYFIFAYDLFAKFEFYYEKTGLIASATVIGAVTNILLNYIFIKKYGFIAAGYTTLLCYFLYAFFHYIAMMKVCKEKCDNTYPYNSKKLLLITIVFLIIGFIFLFLYNSVILRYLFIIMLLFILFIFRKKCINYCKLMINIKKGNN